MQGPVSNAECGKYDFIGGPRFVVRAHSECSERLLVQYYDARAGQGSEDELWAFNFSTQSPRDGNGETFSSSFAKRLKRNQDRYSDGPPFSVDSTEAVFLPDTKQKLHCFLLRHSCYWNSPTGKYTGSHFPHGIPLSPDSL